MYSNVSTLCEYEHLYMSSECLCWSIVFRPMNQKISKYEYISIEMNDRISMNQFMCTCVKITVRI